MLAAAWMVPLVQPVLAAADAEVAKGALIPTSPVKLELLIRSLEEKRTDRKAYDELSASDLWRLHRAYLSSDEPSRAAACALSHHTCLA